jgi:hypothetical protein
MQSNIYDVCIVGGLGLSVRRRDYVSIRKGSV